MLTRTSGGIPPSPPVEAPPALPDTDDESVTGMPGLAERANYDSSDDEEMTDLDDEASPRCEDKDDDADDAGHGYGHDGDSEGEEVISFSTVNPGDHVLIAEDKCRIATMVSGDAGPKLCVCPRLASTCKQHRSHVDNGTKTRYLAGFYLRYPRSKGNNRDVPGLINGPFFTVEEMIPIIDRSRIAATKVGNGGYESDSESEPEDATPAPRAGGSRSRMKTTPVRNLRDSLKRATTPSPARRKTFTEGGKGGIACMVSKKGKKSLALDDQAILQQCMKGAYVATTVSTGTQAAKWLSLPVSEAPGGRVSRNAKNTINVGISVNSSDSEGSRRRRRRRKAKKVKKSKKLKSKRSSHRGRRHGNYSSSSSDDSDSDSDSSSSSSSSSESSRGRHQSRQRRSKSSKKPSSISVSALKEINTGRKDPSVGTPDAIYGMSVQSSIIDKALGPPQVKMKEIGEIYDIAPDILALPGTSSNVFINDSDVGSQMADAFFRRSRHERAVKKDTSFNHASRHALRSIHDEDSLLVFADSLDEEEPHTRRHFEGAITTFMLRRSYDTDIIEEYRTEGGLAQIINKTFIFYKALIEKLRQECRTQPWPC